MASGSASCLTSQVGVAGIVPERAGPTAAEIVLQPSCLRYAQFALDSQRCSTRRAELPWSLNAVQRDLRSCVGVSALFNTTCGAALEPQRCSTRRAELRWSLNGAQQGRRNCVGVSTLLQRGVRRPVSFMWAPVAARLHRKNQEPPAGSRTGDLLITKLARRFSAEFYRSSPSAAEACCAREVSPSLLPCG